MKENMFQYLIVFTLFFVFSGCSRKSNDNDIYNNFENRIIQYHRAAQNYTIDPIAGNPKVYIDFSDGMVQAYTNNPTNKDIIQAITNKLVGNDIKWYSLGNSKIEELPYSSNQLFNTITNPNGYKDNMAPIQEALQQITSSPNDALLITDFEEYSSDGKEQFQNYPKVYFSKWLKAGNKITFFYTDYQETNKRYNIKTKKHLYFTVFSFGQITDKSIVTQVKAALEGRNYTRSFELGGEPFLILNKYDGKEGTGIANKTFQKWVNFNYNGLASNNNMFEVIGLNKSWNEDIEKYVENIIQKENGLFLSHLYLNTADKSYYKLKNIKVNCYDISEDYGRFVKCMEAIHNKPEFITDKGKNKVWDEKSKNNQIITECYVKNTDKIKDEWIYKPSNLSGKVWEEVFELDSKAFSDQLKNDPANIELTTLIHQKFKNKNIKVANALLRIDLVCTDIEFNFSDEKLKDFEWASATTKNKENKSLSEAIRNTLQDPDISPKNKPLYTYYIKLGLHKKDK